MDRIDARDKANGTSQYVGDIVLDHMCHAAMVRSSEPHARILHIDTEMAISMPGVIAIYTARDIFPGLYGRWTRDIPLLAKDKVRYVGERVAAVVAETRDQAEAAAAYVIVDYEPLYAVTTIDEAINAPVAVHDEPWTYPRSPVKQGGPLNVQADVAHGSLDEIETALAGAAFLLEATYQTQSVHHGYLETQASVADVDNSSGKVRLWCTNKSPYPLRQQIADCLDMDPTLIEVQPSPIGGDFGGKGSPGDAPLVVELSRRLGRPVKSVLRYSEDLIATNPRHPSRIHVRLGADASGAFVGLSLDSELNGGAYIGAKPMPDGTIGGFLHVHGYRLPVFYARERVYFTNTVSRGHMRAPGYPQCNFAVESAIDELAGQVGIDPIKLRRRNLMRTGETAPHGNRWFEHRGHESLDAALSAPSELAAPPGWLVGSGLSVSAREDYAFPMGISVRMTPRPGGVIEIEIASAEQGAGIHTAVRKMMAEQLGCALEQIEIVQVSTHELQAGAATGGATTTVAYAHAVAQAAAAWKAREDDGPVTVEVTMPDREVWVGAYTVQVAQVAVDPETGQLKVLDILTVCDVANVVNELAHQMQIDGGTVMGYGYACLEDLDESEGQVWAANLGEFKIPSERDIPRLRTILLRGGHGVDHTGVKQIGESTTPPVPAAIANAIANATGARLRLLPLTAERLFRALEDR